MAKPTIVAGTRSLGRRLQLERRLNRAPGTGLHRPDPTEPPARHHDRRPVRRLVPRAAHGGPVVLVGHSYGGFVVTNAALAGGDVKALVYVDAFMPDEGETTFVVLGDSGSALAVPDPTTVLDVVGYPGAPEGDADAYLKPDAVHPPSHQISPRPTGG